MNKHEQTSTPAKPADATSSKRDLLSKLSAEDHYVNKTELT